ncbi:MAG: hypothetical protein FJ363_08230 [Gemmatimonadetes bacterium]|nr:hypothetical protein [Gemmatimonadota bacterium]
MPDKKWRPVFRRFPRPYDDIIGPNDPVGSWRVAARWWEPRRVAYNAVLVLVFLLLAARHWDRFAPELSLGNVGRLFVLALLANLCYSTAYPWDMALQTVRTPSKRAGWRWGIWIAGTLAAVLIETYWFLDEILPPPQ